MPACPRCKSAAFEFKNRPLFGCKNPDCAHRFSLTSGPDFSYRKLSYKQIMMIMVELTVSNQGISTREVLRRVRSIRHYKTVFLWIMKVRHALKRRQETYAFEGEVEIDGVEVGGYIRPKNTRKEKTDNFKVPYRASDRTMYITFLRHRGSGCPARAWVAEREHHPVQRIKDALIASAAPQRSPTRASGVRSGPKSR